MSTHDREILLQAEGLGPGRGEGTFDAETRSVWLSRDLKGLKSFAPLLEAPNLERILINVDHKIPTFDSITSLKQLKKIILRGNLSIASLAALEEFPQLAELELGKIFPLLDGLALTPHTVRVEATGVKEVGFLRNFRNLRHLSLGSGTVYTQISDETDFTPVAGIHSLYLLSRLLTRLDRLGVLKQLRSLWVPANKKLKSLGGVEQLAQLEALAFYRCSVSDIAPLRGLPLRYLVMGENRIRSLKQLDNPQLIQLKADNLPLKVFDVQIDLPQLELLALFDTELTRIDELARFTSLKRLELASVTGVTDFSPLSALRNLEHLLVHKTAISAQEVERLLELPALRIIDITDTPASASERIGLLKEQAQQRGIALCTTYSEYSKAMDPTRRERKGMEHYMTVFTQEGDPASTGYHI